MERQGLILFMTVILLLIVLLISILRLNYIEKNKHFFCLNCGKKLKISKYKMLVTPHYFSRLYLKCPSCNQRSWMRRDND